MTLPTNFVSVDRYWFLTWTTYGSWLPGDKRGYVGEVIDERGRFINQNQFGTPVARPNPNLSNAVEQNLKARSILLDSSHADALFQQFTETTEIRRWLLIAVAIMTTRLHVIVGVPGDPDPEKILGDLKAYGSRCLNRIWGKPVSDTWWTQGGSKRKLADDHAVEAAVHYIRQQANPLLIWTREDGLVSRNNGADKCRVKNKDEESGCRRIPAHLAPSASRAWGTFA